MVDQERSRRGRRNRQRGAEKEWATARLLREEGWEVSRNTHGAYDLMALKAGETPRIIEIKSGQHPFNNYGPKERAETIEAAEKAGADAYLAHWVPYTSSPVYIKSSEWPGPRKR